MRLKIEIVLIISLLLLASAAFADRDADHDPDEVLRSIGIAADARAEKPAGVECTQVYWGFPAWEAGLRAGDVIVSANRDRVETIEQLTKVVAEDDGVTQVRYVRPDRGDGRPESGRTGLRPDDPVSRAKSIVEITIEASDLLWRASGLVEDTRLWTWDENGHNRGWASASTHWRHDQAGQMFLSAHWIEAREYGDQLRTGNAMQFRSEDGVTLTVKPDDPLTESQALALGVMLESHPLVVRAEEFGNTVSWKLSPAEIGHLYAVLLIHKDKAQRVDEAE